MPGPTPPADRQPLDVLVIGAGQAGLALGHHLAARSAEFLLVDAGPAIGRSWRSRMRLDADRSEPAPAGPPDPAVVPA